MDAATQAKTPYLLPAGTHAVGTLKLRSGTHFRFASGAVIKMLPLNADYSPIEKLDFEPYADLETSRFEHALFFATDADGVTIDGPGRIECDRTGRGGPKTVSLRRCKNIKLDGITIDQAPNYAISLIGCSRVDIGNVKITRGHSDGIDLDSTTDAFIHDVEVDSFDDAICLKASASLGKKMATRNVKFERCRLRSASVFFKIGTESYGDFQAITARSLTMIGGLGNRHGNPGIA
ncbi:MAG: glycosyl hydrolase family 28 protein, partial [Chloroflexia bacterium]